MKKVILLSSISLIANLCFAQIVYTDVKPDMVLTSANDDYAYIDITQPASAIKLNPASLVGATELALSFPGGAKIGAGADIEMVSDNLGDPISLPKDMELNSSTQGWKAGKSNGIYMNASMHWATGVADKYIGVRVKKNATWHYGWLKLDYVNNDKIVIKEYAYQSTSGTGIKTGQITTTHIPNVYNHKIKVAVINKYINISGIETPVTMRIINMSGQMVKSVAISSNQQINLSELPNGNYIINISGLDCNSFYKIVL